MVYVYGNKHVINTLGERGQRTIYSYLEIATKIVRRYVCDCDSDQTHGSMKTKLCKRVFKRKIWSSLLVGKIAKDIMAFVLNTSRTICLEWFITF